MEGHGRQVAGFDANNMVPSSRGLIVWLTTEQLRCSRGGKKRSKSIVHYRFFFSMLYDKTM